MAMTLQEILDTVVDHLLAQGKQSVVAGVCRYRSKDGLSCAVGCLIKDEFYVDSMEGAYADSSLVVDILHSSGVIPNCNYTQPGLRLLCDLQGAHDDAENWVMGGFNLESIVGICKKYNLVNKYVND